MPVNLLVPENVHPVAGVELASTSAGIKSNGDPDLVLVTLVEGSCVAGVFTQNSFSAAPVILCREHLKIQAGAIRALLINSGGANAATGVQGDLNARRSCAIVAEHLELPEPAVLPFSTGVIGEQLPMQKIEQGIATLCSELSSEKWGDVARGIMTTDIMPKIVSRKITLSDTEITLTGIAKGSGMIEPNMATMLAYVFTDAHVAPAALQDCLTSATARSFNSITVDGDTSTNDSFILAATAQAKTGLLEASHSDWDKFCEAVNGISLELAQAIVRDGEGASKFLSIQVSGAQSEQDARQVGLTVGNSPLVKTAFFASDANLGRIIMAVGRSGVAGLDINRLSLRLGDVDVFTDGQPAGSYTEERGSNVMSQQEIDVYIDLGCGSSTWTIYACDFSHDYVSINADYRS